MDDIRKELAQLRAEVRALRDREAIADVLRRYARGLDRHDVELEATAFWPDAQVNYGFYSGQRDDFIEWGNATHALSLAGHEHHLTTQTIDIDGDEAHVESYVLFFLRAKDDGSTFVGGARYLDRMERRGGEWRIAVREFLPEIAIKANSVFVGEFEDGMRPRSGDRSWDRTDLSYRRPLSRRDAPPAGQDNTEMSIFKD
jgi:hypothetical protein